MEEETPMPCSICGENHLTDSCSYIPIVKHVSDKKHPPKARLTLPDFLEVVTLADGTQSVKTNSKIERGTKFGPLLAEKNFTVNPAVSFLLKIFPCGEDEFLEYFLDTSKEEACNWIIYIEAALNTDEQNLICYQESESIYYVAIRDIFENEVLKVWYSPQYARKMKKCFLVERKSKADPIKKVPLDIEALIKNQQQDILKRDFWTCKFCSTIKKETSSFASHMLEHYYHQLKRCCEICKIPGFVTVKAFKKHIALFHPTKTKESEPQKPLTSSLKINEKSISLNNVGGPLLNNIDMLSDSMDNSNLLVPTSDFDMNPLITDNLLGNDLYSETANEAGTLEHFNFDIGDGDTAKTDEYICDICLKSFQKLKYMVLHLKMHTAEHICMVCLKIFARSESLKFHACNPNLKQKYHCEPCLKTFTQEKYYVRHMKSKHLSTLQCELCKKKYASNFDFKRHSCDKVPQKLKFECQTCGKLFTQERYLQRHEQRHLKMGSKLGDKRVVCSICGKSVFKVQYLQHLKSHKEPCFQCTVCQKMIKHRQNFLSHMESHNETKQQCSTCQKFFKTRKSLRAHKEIHRDKSYKCPKCPNSKIFHTKSSFNKHLKSHLTSRTYLAETFYACCFCDKKFAIRSSLTRHVKKFHSVEYTSLADDNIDLEQFFTKCKKKGKKELESALQIPESIHTNIANLEGKNDILDKENIDEINTDLSSDIDEKLQIQMIDSIISKTTKEMGLETQDDLVPPPISNNISTTVASFEEREICLSMPDLLEEDVEIKLGENAYILENGTIIQPQGNSKNNVVVYVLDKDVS